MHKKDLSETIAWGIVKAVLFFAAVAAIIWFVAASVHSAG